MRAEARRANKGPWTHRFLVHLFTIILGVLIYWLLGFVLDDIGSWPGPDYAAVEQRLLDPALVARGETLQKRIGELERESADQKGRQEILRDSTANSQRTMNQLLEIQRLALQKGVTTTAQEQKSLAESEALFLENQKQYQTLNEDIARLSGQLRDQQQERRDLDNELEERRIPIRREFESLIERHAWKMAALKLAALTPLLAAGVWFFLKQRNGTYAPLAWAFGVAVLAKTALVMHEYFPSRYFKYLLIGGCLVVVVRILVYLLRMIAHPKTDWLLKQYREAYEAFLCPVCEYPIRRGPLKYLFWTRRSLKKLSLTAAAPHEQEHPYTCPMCGTKLFEECSQCHAIRHSLLPVCEQCGTEKSQATAVVSS
ncbi:MAG TPA: hypothetical protein VL475_04580 [Planctomycetaceae bacterium]|jgi:predicted RNA-binding Zn-ribbon protein involved in translation (DUF1610 family)|nr:hypothetical protein [Planctomycetaceae bacterium]